MRLVHHGGSRQDAHEHIRVLSHQASDVVKKEGKDNDLIDRIRREPFFEPILSELNDLLDPSTFVGRAPQQTEKFVGLEVKNALQSYAGHIKTAGTVELNV
jgi:adenylosuccinate lyase